MTSIKAREHDDEPVTADVLARSVELGRKQRPSTMQAQEVRYLAEFGALAVSFADKAAILLPVKNYAELAQLSPAELGRVEIGFGGSALCLHERDMHLSIAGLVSASESLMALASTVIATRNGSRSSDAKVLAARANGQKGGRPRKVASAPSLVDAIEK